MPRSLMTTVTCVQRLREVRPEVPVVLCTAHARARIALHRMVEVGELKGITQEEDRCVVSNHVPISLLRIELHCEAANIALGVRRATLTGYRREASKHRSGLADIGEDLRLGVLGDIVRYGEGSESTCALGMHTPLRNHLTVKVGHLLDQPNVLEQGRTPLASGLNILVVTNGGTERCCQFLHN